jgi:hypothetical protein
MTLRRRLHRALLLAALFIAAPVGARAQTNVFAVTGFPLTFSAAGPTEFAAGLIDHPTQISFLVDAATGSGSATRIANVAIRCASPCPSSGVKPAADLQWRRADLATWNSITTSNVTIEQRNMVRGALNDPWGNDVYWRILLSYATDLQGTTITYNLIMTLTMTAP